MTGVKTTVSYGSDANYKNPTTYFRKTFTLKSAPAATDQFQLNYKVDDGCVVWVNGQEAGHINMNQGTVNYNTFHKEPSTTTHSQRPMLLMNLSQVLLT